MDDGLPYEWYSEIYQLLLLSFVTFSRRPTQLMYIYIYLENEKLRGTEVRELFKRRGGYQDVARGILQYWKSTDLLALEDKAVLQTTSYFTYRMLAKHFYSSLMIRAFTVRFLWIGIQRVSLLMQVEGSSRKPFEKDKQRESIVSSICLYNKQCLHVIVCAVTLLNTTRIWLGSENSCWSPAGHGSSLHARMYLLYSSSRRVYYICWLLTI